MFKVTHELSSRGNSVGLLEGVEITAFHIDLPSTLDERNPTLFAILPESLRGNVEFLTYACSIKVLLLRAPILPFGLNCPEVLSKLISYRPANNLLQLIYSYCYDFYCFHFCAIKRNKGIIKFPNKEGVTNLYRILYIS